MRKKALLRVALGLGTIIVVVFGFYLMGNYFSNSHNEHSHIEMHEEASHDDSHLDSINVDTMTEKELDKFLTAEDNINHLATVFEKADEYNKYKIACRVLELNKKEGFGFLISILQNGELPFVKEEVNSKIKEISSKDFGYDAMNDNQENQKAIDEMIKWKTKL